MVSRFGTQQDSAATHFLESQGQALSAGLEHSKTQQSLTLWTVKNRHCQHASNTASHSSHSLSGQSRTGIVSMLQTQPATVVTHKLESQGQALSAGWKTESYSSHSLPGEPRKGIVSRLEPQQATAATHFLESQGKALLVGLKHSKPQEPLTPWRAKSRHFQPEAQQNTETTHKLESQEQTLSAYLKHSKSQQPLTP